MENAPGIALKKLVKKELAGPLQMRLFAAALIKLQRSSLLLDHPFGIEQHLEIRCAGLHGSLAEEFPALRNQVKWIVERARALERCGSPALTPAHGDFHLGQVQVMDDEAWV